MDQRIGSAYIRARVDGTTRIPSPKVSRLGTVGKCQQDRLYDEADIEQDRFESQPSTPPISRWQNKSPVTRDDRALRLALVSRVFCGSTIAPELDAANVAL